MKRHIGQTLACRLVNTFGGRVLERSNKNGAKQVQLQTNLSAPPSLFPFLPW